MTIERRRPLSVLVFLQRGTDSNEGLGSKALDPWAVATALLAVLERRHRVHRSKAASGPLSLGAKALDPLAVATAVLAVLER